MSDPNGLCLTTSNTSSLVSNSSSQLSSAKNSISNKFKNVLNRKRSKSFMSPESIEPISLRSNHRNKSVSSIQYSPTPSTIATFEHNNINSRSNSTSSISDTDSTIEAPITPISPLFKIDETSTTGKFPEKSRTSIKVMEQNEEIFDNIADGILERINKNESKIEWTI